MHYRKFLPILLFLLGMTLILAACGQSETPAASADSRSSGVAFPADYRENFVHYATVQRKDGTTRDLYISPEAIDEFNGGRLPDGTVIVIDGFDAPLDENGDYQRDENERWLKGAAFDRLHVIEKRDQWSDEDFVSAARIGDWNFGSFVPETGDLFEEDMNACFNCHNPTAHTDFLYSHRLLSAFIRTGEVQYFYCDLSERIAC